MSSLDKITISPTDEYGRLEEMFAAQGLEVSAEDEVPTDIIKCWKAEDGAGTLLGGAVLAKREGEFICDGIATVPPARSVGLGKKLLLTLMDEARERGGDRLFLVARAPEFFRSRGFKTVDRDDAPLFFECFSCPQYNDTCFPEVMERRI